MSITTARRNREPQPPLIWYPKPTHLAQIVTVIPSRRDEEGDLVELRSLDRCKKIAKAVASLDGVLEAAFSRTQVHIAMDAPAGDDVWAAIVDQIRTTTRVLDDYLVNGGLVHVELDGWVDTNPLEWYRSFRAVEATVREAIGDRHQCGTTSLNGCGTTTNGCICALRGNEKDETPGNLFGARGSFQGPGALK